MYLIVAQLFLLIDFTFAQCQTAYVGDDDDFCTLDFDTYEESCEEITDVDYISYGLTMNPINGEIYMIVPLDIYDYYSSVTPRSIIKFDVSDPNDYDVIATYTNSPFFMEGITFGGCESDSDSNTPILYTLSDYYYGSDNLTIWKIDTATGTTEAVITITNWTDDDRGIAYSPYVDKIYLFDKDYYYDDWSLLEFDPNFDYGSQIISRDELNNLTTISNDDIGYTISALAVYDEEYVLIQSYYDIYKVSIEDPDDITCIGDLTGYYSHYGAKGLVCADMSQNYLDFANCDDTGDTKETRPSADSEGCLEFVKAYDSSGSADAPIGWILFLIATIFVCLFAIFKNDYVRICCGKNK